MNKLVHNGADRVRIEVEIGGKLSIVELRARGDEKIAITVSTEHESRELPHDQPFREFEPTGRVQVALSAFGFRDGWAEEQPA